MTPPPSDQSGAVRRTFLITLLVLIVPSMVRALAHGPNLARFAGATFSTVLVWWFLYRLSMRSTRPAWFTAISIPALYVATFWAPIYAWGVLLVLMVIHRFVGRYFPAPMPVEVPYDELPGNDAYEGRRVDASLDATAASFRIVDLDRIGRPYRRILLVLRIIRAGTASLANSALLVGPAMFFFALYDGYSPVAGLMGGFAFAIFLGGFSVLFFAWLRALWRGSVRAARRTAFVTVGLAAVSAVMGIATIDRELVVTGGIWFHLSAYALEVGLFTAVAIGSAMVVRHREDQDLMSLLRQNGGYTWRESVQQLAGIVLPRGWSLGALTHRSFVLSVIAFTMEGAAFYVYFDAVENLLQASDGVRAGRLAPFPGPKTSLEIHYASLVTIVALMLPVLYVATQVVLALAEGLRRAARRAALRPADELLMEDRRPPVLFLRDFTDDQVALDQAAVPNWVRLVDPGNVQANLEDVMQAYASVGPVVAIGRPGDKTPPIGVARRYVGNDKWQGVVLSLMDSAAALVVGVSDSEGVTWEIDQTRARGHLAKSVFVLPPTRRGNHSLTHRLLERLLPQTDPVTFEATRAALARRIGRRRVAGLVVRDGTVRLFVTDRRPSQVEFDVTLRLSRPPATGASAVH